MVFYLNHEILVTLSVSNAEKSRQLSEIADRYGFGPIKELAEAPTQALEVRIGFVGEFSSGKSTLINAVLGEELLPSRGAPTTANIIQIEADASLESPEYLAAESGGGFQMIDAAGFAALACGETSGTLRMRVPPRGLLQPGIQLIDSPGINALVAGHAEITIAQLSLLDGLVVCLHPEMGTVPASLLRFLEREEIKRMWHKLVFVLTAADQKAPASAARVAENMAAALARVMPEDAPRPAIIQTRALDALAGETGGIEEFLQVFQTRFAARAETLREERRAAQLRHCAGLIRTALLSYQQSMAYSDDEFRQKLADAQLQADLLQRTKREEESRLEEWYKDFQLALQAAGERFAPVLARAQPHQIDDAFSQLQSALEDVALTHIRRYAPGADIQGRALPLEFKSALASALEAHGRYIQTGVTAATMIAVTVVTAGAGAGAAVATEAGAAGAAAQSASATAVGAAKAGTAAAAKTALKKTAETAAESLLTKVFKSSIAQLAGVVKAINPLEAVGDVALVLWNGSAAKETLPLLTARLAQAYHADMLRHLGESCFRPLEEELAAAKRGMAEARAARTAGLESFARQRGQIRNDLLTLDTLAQKA